MNSSTDGTDAPLDLIPPAFLSIPDRVDSLGAQAVTLAAICGITLDPEQVLALDAILSVIDEDGDDRFAALEAALIQARQNGKTGGVLAPLALLAAIRRPDQLIVWSAHRYKTSHEAFLSLLRIVKTTPEVEARVSKVSFSNGEEAFEFHNGSRIVFIARSQASGRGLSGDLVILDEALFLTAEMMGALMPTLSARPDPLVVYASSAGLATSAVLHDVKDRGRAGNDPSLVYVEWCAPPSGACATRDCDHHRDAVGCMLDDPANWRAANPAHVRGRISARYIAAERRSLNPSEFARERLGWWDEKGRGGLFHLPAWWKRQDDRTTPGPRVSFALHVTPDRAWSSVAVASRRGDGALHLEIIEHREGVSWVAPYLTDLTANHKPQALVIAGAMAAGALASDIESLRGFKSLNSTEVRRACAGLYDLIHADGEPVAIRKTTPELNTALESAVTAARRSTERGEWVFDADPGDDLSPLYALALAAHAVRGKRAPKSDAELLASAY